MRWDAWAPHYAALLHDFGWDRRDDERARDTLDALLADKRRVPDRALRALLEGHVVPVVGPAPGVEQFEPPATGPWIATDGAVDTLNMRGLRAPIVVTDLDGNVDAQTAWNRAGSMLVVHAHGHNADALREHVPRLEGPLVGTTQAAPRGRVRNYGGFTDGDRAVFLAAHFGARAVRLVGFDLDAPVPKAGGDPDLKACKLAWAKRLLPLAGAPLER